VSAVRLTIFIYGIKSVFALLNKTYPRPLRPSVTMMKKPVILQRNSRETRSSGVARNVMMMGPKALQQDLAIRFCRAANKDECGDAPCPTSGPNAEEGDLRDSWERCTAEDYELNIVAVESMQGIC
jgi:hypothetical protein